MVTDDNTLTIAIELAIRWRNLELLAAVLVLGYCPESHYDPEAIQGVPYNSALEQAIYVGWNEGFSLMTTLH